MNAFDLLVACAGIGSLFLASVLIGHELFKKRGKEKEIFDRYHVEEAMRIKARQYKNRN